MSGEITAGSTEGEVAHLIDKSSEDVQSLVTVGLGLTMLLLGFLTTTQQLQACSSTSVQPEFQLVCQAGQNKILTVFLSVWLPIITYCLLRYYQVDSLSARYEPSYYSLL